MKKFLSLVLALTMTMSLVTVSAGAKDFTDSSKIEYKEAVDVVSAAGIVEGYEDGAFNPQNTLTRGAAAKIICNLILGPTTAGALVADTAPYSDVPTTNTFAGYIAYCQKEGIISGYADGTFRPAATLTGYAFMKMLLGALGYDSEIEGYTGSNWSIAVGKRALGIELDDGNDNFVGTAAVTREEACLYAFNTLKATMVEYKDKSTVTVGDITIANKSTATEVERTSGKDYKAYNGSSTGRLRHAAVLREVLQTT
ncbi:MAG: S-layer homology domain-containing protein [Dysosmobacter sp.]